MRSILVALIALSLSAGGVEEVQGQRFSPREVQSWPDTLFNCVSDGPTMSLLSQFAPGRSEVTTAIFRELEGMRSRIAAHASSSPDHCFIVLGGADPMLWRGTSTNPDWVHTGNDALVAHARAYIVGSLLHENPFSVEMGRVRIDVLPGELPRSTSIILGRFLRESAQGEQIAIADLRDLIVRNNGQLIGAMEELENLRNRVGALENRADGTDRRLDNHETRISALEARRSGTPIDLLVGAGYDMNTDYRMPRASASVLISNQAEVSGWFGMSPSATSATWDDQEVEVRNRGWGLRLSWLPSPCGPSVEGFKYESVVTERGEFSETKRGLAGGIVCRLPLGYRVNIHGSAGYGLYEHKQALGEATNESEFRFSIGAEISLTGGAQ